MMRNLHGFFSSRASSLTLTLVLVTTPPRAVRLAPTTLDPGTAPFLTTPAEGGPTFRGGPSDVAADLVRAMTCAGTAFSSFALRVTLRVLETYFVSSGLGKQGS